VSLHRSQRRQTLPVRGGGEIGVMSSRTPTDDDIGSNLANLSPVLGENGDRARTNGREHAQSRQTQGYRGWWDCRMPHPV